MRVLRIVSDLDPKTGGPTTVHSAAAISLRAAGAHVECLTLDPDGCNIEALPDYQRLSKAGIKIHVFSNVKSACLFVYRARRRFDVVHVDGCWWMINVIPVLIAKALGLVVFLTPHESLTTRDMGQARSLFRKFGKRLLTLYYQRFADCIVYSSHLEREDSVKHRDAIVIPHPVFDDTRSETAIEVRKGRVAADHLHLGYLGRFHPKKRLHEIVMASVSTEKTRLIVAGSGPKEYEQEIRALAGSGTGNVVWRGFVQNEQREEFFRAIDFLVLASDYECFGMAAAEALVRGIPVIVTERVGVAAASENKGGFVVKGGVESLQKAFARCLALPQSEYDRLQNGALKAAALYSFSAHGKAQIDAYGRVEAKSRARRRPGWLTVQRSIASERHDAR